MCKYDMVLYHGTTHKNGTKILNTKYKTSKTKINKKSNKKSDHWLGDGVYFFEDKIHVYDWILKLFRNHHNLKIINNNNIIYSDLFSNYMILSSKIETDINRVWDLNNPENYITYTEICDEIYNKIRNDKEFENYEISDGTFINIMFEKMGFNKYYDIVTYTFGFHRPHVQYNTHMKTILQKQICVKNLDVIKSTQKYSPSYNEFEEYYKILCNVYPHIY